MPNQTSTRTSRHASRFPEVSELSAVAPVPLATVAPDVLNARELLGHGGRVSIEHEGSLYELRLTRNNKLILTK